MSSESGAARPSEKGSRGTFLSASTLCVVALVAGGGSVRFPLTELIVELMGVAALVSVIICWRRPAAWNGFRTPMLIGALILALILIQLVPLPPALWTGMAGRALAADTAQALGWAGQWRPLSIDPEATARSALALIPGMAMFMAVANLPPTSHIRIVRLLTILAAAMLIPGFLQIASGGQHFYLYSAASGSSHRDVPTGLFVNRNHFAAFLLIAIVACGALARRNSGRLALLPAILGTALAAMVLATSSRTGAVLLPVAALAAVLLARRHIDRRTWLTASASIALIALLLTVIAYHGLGGSIERLLARFGENEESRFEFWPVALTVAHTWFPWGSGIGTFDMAFRAGEPLSIVGSHYVNHAHNDFLEIAIEAGLAGLLLIAAFLAWLVRAGSRAWREPIRHDTDLLARMAFVGLVLLMLHSLVDYPLRTLALETIFGLLVGLLAARGNDFRASKPENSLEKPS